ncbi:hypothetical protein [Henriciella sp.]|jgi:hypothetical protein|uniref:hypothetical protein n=1 Tax=Henriciella sp. TaxID=1968823 RepID=UPI0025C6378E|nr:hypothetical protein [Henriciella sp.]|tara:strand:+ start:1323 stop:1715 length:393 start_codon:yes stop_codon:yes gene_type:complete
MLKLFRGLSMVSIKIVATFFMVIILMLLGIVFFPRQLNQVNDVANWIANLDIIRNPDIPQTAVAVFRNFVNETTIFGILMTLIARAFVEFVAWLFGLMWRLANPKEKDGDEFKRRAFDPSEDVPPTYTRN